MARCSFCFLATVHTHCAGIFVKKALYFQANLPSKKIRSAHSMHKCFNDGCECLTRCMHFEINIFKKSLSFNNETLRTHEHRFFDAADLVFFVKFSLANIFIYYCFATENPIFGVAVGRIS